ncbi:MAG TPA: TonB-dependent receptor plug domain-containing protein, partial [Longimicrobium sp.]|nr:TonB-dependent receptor plug domain-containing protein [Longimicrobium sp.]
MKWKAALLCLLGLALLPGHARAQSTGRVTGTVTDAGSGQPLAAATVTVAGTSLSTATDAQGRYTLAGVPAGSRSVSAARLGYGTGQRTVTVAAGAEATANFALSSSVLLLDEVVVVGYGEQERRDVTGSVASVNTAALEDVPVQSLDQMLQGTVAGVQVTQASSAPGGGISIRVRGSSSISGSSEPLYVIDGFPIENDPEGASPGSGGRTTATVPSNPLAALNPSDIESIQILKDASATAIYGARGANGVVIVTTRRGRAGRPELSFDVFTGTQAVANRYELLDARELATAINEASVDGGGTAVFGQAFIDTLGAGTDWQDEIFRDAPLRGFQGSVSGGTSGDNVTRYAVSGGYFDQTGVVLGSGFERYSLRASLDQGIGNRLRFGATLTGSRVNSTFIPTEGESNARAGAVGAAIQAYPFLPVRLADGRYPYQGRDLPLVGVPSGQASNLVNPVSLAEEVTDRLGDTRVLGNAFGEWEPLSGLRGRVALGADFSSRFRDTYYPRLTRRGEEAGGEAIRGRAEVLSYLNENTL